MTNGKIEQEPTILSVADSTSAVALGLQRAIDARGAALNDKILIYGGLFEFKVQVLPQTAMNFAKEMTNIGQG
jgi:hypothetical protein